MYSIDLKDAEYQLAKIIEDAAQGEDVIITRSDGSSFKLVPMQPKTAEAPITLKSAFEEAGLIGCLETDDQLATTYKDKLDFSVKHGNLL